MAVSSLNVAFGRQIAAAAQRHHLDPRLLAAVAAQETGGPQSDSGRNIVGDGGHGHGIFQIDDRWHPFAQTPAAMDPAANAEYAARMLSGFVKHNGGDVHAALSCYNAGSAKAAGTKTTWGDGKTLGYADSVLRHYQRISASSLSPGAIAATRDAQVAALPETTPQTNALRTLFMQLGTATTAPSAATTSASASSTSSLLACPSIPAHKKSELPKNDSSSILAPGDDDPSQSNLIV